MKRTYSFLMLILMSASFASNASTICVSQAKITQLLVPNNGTAEIQFKPAEHSAASSAYDAGRVRMWQGDSYVNWKVKVDILRDAFLSDKTITVGSKDNNCTGNDTEFYITEFK
ncbi:hypothetical protein [Aliivibrio fischeri]|uniref:hypothetical protein n=1 Tax=Aliivibrio fischeri TaxID=668 RepID=UPI0007C4F05C|nr:hypothetical protein [Aliivibrio fischeri]